MRQMEKWYIPWFACSQVTIAGQQYST